MSAINRPVLTVDGFHDFRMWVDPRCKLVDMKAFLATYSVRLDRNGSPMLHGPVSSVGGPLHIVDMKTSTNIPPFREPFDDPSKRDQSFAVSLTPLGPPADDDPMREELRWPFHVSERLEVVFVLSHVDPFNDQWWKFVFEPGQQYKERTNV